MPTSSQYYWPQTHCFSSGPMPRDHWCLPKLHHVETIGALFVRKLRLILLLVCGQTIPCSGIFSSVNVDKTIINHLFGNGLYRNTAYLWWWEDGYYMLYYSRITSNLWLIIGPNPILRILLRFISHVTQWLDGGSGVDPHVMDDGPEGLTSERTVHQLRSVAKIPQGDPPRRSSIPLLLALLLQCPRQAGHISTAQHQGWRDAKAQLVASQLGQPNGLPWRNHGGFGGLTTCFWNSEDPLYSTKESRLHRGRGFLNSAVYS